MVSTSSVSSWFIIEPCDDLRGMFWELMMSDVSLDSVVEVFWGQVEDTGGSESDVTPLGQGASITFGGKNGSNTD